MHIPSLSPTSIVPHRSAPSLPAVPAPPRTRPQQASPAAEVAARYGRNLLTLPGALSFGWGSRRPDVLRIEFSSEYTATVAAGLLRATIDGATIECGVAGSPDAVTVPAHESAGSASDRVHAIAAMNGIWSYRYAHTGQEQHGSIMFSAVSDAAVEQLKPILRPKLSFGWMPNGDERFLYLSWYVGVPGGGRPGS